MTPIQKGMAEAQIAGRPRFFGPPCKVCGGTNRYSCNGRCVRCSNEISRDWHRLNKEITNAEQMNGETAKGSEQ